MSYPILCLFTFTQNKNGNYNITRKKIRNSFAICLINTRRTSSCSTHTHTPPHTHTHTGQHGPKLTLHIRHVCPGRRLSL